MFKSGCIWLASTLFSRGNVLSERRSHVSLCALRIFHFPTQPPNENNNFDHNKAAKIISRGSWLNIVPIDKIKIFIITECFALLFFSSTPETIKWKNSHSKEPQEV